MAVLQTPDFHPHLHLLMADGLFLRDERFLVLPENGMDAVEELFRARLITFLSKQGLLPPGRTRMLKEWKHSGFNVHRSRRIQPDEHEDLERVARYIIRNPFTTEKMEFKHELFPFIELAAALQGHARLFELLAPVCERAGIVVETETDRRRQKFAKALRYIGQNLNEPNPVGSIAAVMSQHPFQFSRQFKQAFGVSPVQYIQRRRIAIAARLLLSTDRKLYDIASELGFSDGFHLSKTFKRIIGQSPAAYRRSNPHHQP